MTKCIFFASDYIKNNVVIVDALKLPKSVLPTLTKYLCFSKRTLAKTKLQFASEVCRSKKRTKPLKYLKWIGEFFISCEKLKKTPTTTKKVICFAFTILPLNFFSNCQEVKEGNYQDKIFFKEPPLTSSKYEKTGLAHLWSSLDGGWSREISKIIPAHLK